MKDAKRFAISRTGEIRDGGQIASIARLAVPMVFTVLFLLSVLMTSGYLLQGTATEKENKVVEVLLASANPDEILAGKLLGLGGAGLLQIVVWLTMMFAMGLEAIPLLLESHIEMPWLALAIALPLFMVAFLFFGSLMLGNRIAGIEHARVPATRHDLVADGRAPDDDAGRDHPRAARSTGARADLDPVHVEPDCHDSRQHGRRVARVVGDRRAVSVLALATWVAIRVGARLFRVGLLSSGARPSFREVWRQARLGH